MIFLPRGRATNRKEEVEIGLDVHDELGATRQLAAPRRVRDGDGDGNGALDSARVRRTRRPGWCETVAVAPALTLVHSPLVSSTTWGALAAALGDRGREVHVPDLTSSVFDGPPYLSKQVAEVVDVVAGRPTILVGHSAAGPLLAAAGESLQHVKGYIFVDAGFPFPGLSWFDSVPAELADQLRSMATGAWLPPWPQWWEFVALAELLPDPDVRERFVAACPPLPVAMFEEVQPPVPDWPDAPCGYLRLSEAYRGPAQRARARLAGDRAGQ